MGFDRISRIEKTQGDDLDRWSRFISNIEEQSEDDSSVGIHFDYHEFCVAEQPMLPNQGQKFLHFASEIRGSSVLKQINTTVSGSQLCTISTGGTFDTVGYHDIGDFVGRGEKVRKLSIRY